MKLLCHLIHELMPALCLLCDEPVGPDELACAQHRFPVADSVGARCARCARALPRGFPEGYDCAECLKSAPAFAAVHCAADYHGPAREWLLAFKHGGQAELADFLALQLDARLPRPAGPAEPALLVPVPLHRWRHLARGFDQAHRLARALAERRGLECVRILRRVRSTRPQGSALALSRESNVRAAFQLRRGAQERIQGRCVWLVDDVLTSGATADECARCLLQAGAARVEVVVVARA